MFCRNLGTGLPENRLAGASVLPDAESFPSGRGDAAGRHIAGAGGVGAMFRTPWLAVRGKARQNLKVQKVRTRFYGMPRTPESQMYQNKS